MTINYTSGPLTKIALNGTPMAALSCTLGLKEVLLQRNGIRGTRSHFDTDVRKGPKRVGGSINLQPSYSELVAIMALALGSSGTADEALTAFNCVVDRLVAQYTYTGCKIGRMVLTASQGGIVSCNLDLVGLDEVAGVVALNSAASTVPFILADLTLTLANSARETFGFSLTIDNHLQADRFLNSVNLSQVVEQDRTVTLQTQHPLNDANLELYNQAVAGAAGILALNNATNTATFTFGKLQVPAESADIPGKSELMLTLNMVATKVNGSAAGTTDEVILT